MTPILISALVVAFSVSVLGCALGLALFPWFRSGERKEGHFRPDQSTGSYHVEVRKGPNGEKQITSIRPTSQRELPIVGGVAMLLAVSSAAITTGVLLQLDNMGWELLGILILALLGFGIVGFIDDWRKVYKGVGITEVQKFAGVLLVSLAAAVALNRLITAPHLSARLAYPPYSDFPVLGHLLVNAHFAWIAFFLLMTVTVATTTSLAVDFSDGMDGLAGGLLVSAGLSFAAIILSENVTALWPAAICVLAIAGASMGYLPFNWPSSWKARNPDSGKRRAKIIMGDTGSLALGGLLALVAVISRDEFVLIFIGGIFVLEGLSALISARLLVHFYRRFMVLERFNSGRGFAHTEFPLPFLATPMHHHFDLLNWDRKRLVYGAWLLGAGLGVLGVASTIGTFTWERYLARFAALVLMVLIWQTAPWTRSFFIGLARRRGAPEGEPQRLALYYGFPFKLFGRRMHGRIDLTGITEAELTTPAERLLLWQRMPVFDARAILGYWCYRADAFEDARRIWSRLPSKNLEYRPEIEHMLGEVKHRLALQADGVSDESELLSDDEDDGTEGNLPPMNAARDDPSATIAVSQPLPTPSLAPADADGSGAEWSAPPNYGRMAAFEELPAGDGALPNTLATPDVSAREANPSGPLWTATAWTAAQTSPPKPTPGDTGE
jgi:UDP-N-acetylmuramyl pentapeptide phosphotransferase/UDP-N-acetylglucosamine-1-phosphate transferase